MAVIALGGQTGGGARLLGPMVAQKLGSDYLDRSILQKTARELGATVGPFTRKKSAYPRGVSGSVASALATLSYPENLTRP